MSPPADVNSEPKNPIIGVRAYSEDPEHVAKMAHASARGFQQANVAPIFKHFPGHGSVDVDSHTAMPVLKGTRADLDARELRPYRSGLRTAGRPTAGGVDAVMVGHLGVPQGAGPLRLRAARPCPP